MDDALLYNRFVELYQVLGKLGYYVIASLSASVVLVSAVSLCNRKLNSFLLSSSCLLLFLLAMKFVDYILRKDLGLDKQTVRHLFYLSMAGCYFLCIVSTVWLHSKLKIRRTKYTNMVVISSCITLSALVLFKYVTRVYLGLDSEILRMIYMSSVNSVKLYFAVISLAISIYSIFIFLNSLKRSYKL